MNFNDSLDKAQRGLLDFFFPRRCPFCGRMAGKELLCETCRDDLPWCRKLRTGTFGECAAPLYYEGRVRDALLAFKFKGKIEYLNCFGALMAETAASAYADRFDAITWVPVSKKRLKKRGFDQAKMLCTSLCVDWHTTPQETLRKVADNPPQSGLEDAGPPRQRAGRLRAGGCGEYRRQTPPSGGRHPHHRSHPRRVYPRAEGGGRGGRSLPDAGDGA